MTPRMVTYWSCAWLLGALPTLTLAQNNQPAGSAPPPESGNQPAAAAPTATQPSQGEFVPVPLEPPFAWYAHRSAWGGVFYNARIGSREFAESYRVGRQTERYRQNAAELRQLLAHRLARRYDMSRPAGSITPLPAMADPGEPGGLRGGLRGGYPGYGSPIEEFYDQGSRLEYWRQQELATRESLTLLSFENLFRRGMDQFRAGNYGQAARNFLAAADKNHEDAASRLHAAQSLLAVGQYADALRYMRRAFELHPHLMDMPLNFSGDYTIKSDYDDHLAALEAHVAAHPEDRDALLLLGCAQFFGNSPQKSGATMSRIKPLAKRDPLAQKLLAAAAPIVPEAR